MSDIHDDKDIQIRKRSIGIGARQGARALSHAKPEAAGNSNKIKDLLSGESGLWLPVVKWVMHGAIADQFPALQSSKDDWQPVLWIDLNGVIHIYERSPIPSIWEDGCCAIGSGREYAMAAMHLGCSAKEAVEVANALSCDCGRGVDVLDLRVAK